MPVYPGHRVDMLATGPSQRRLTTDSKGGDTSLHFALFALESLEADEEVMLALEWGDNPRPHTFL